MYSGLSGTKYFKYWTTVIAHAVLEIYGSKQTDSDSIAWGQGLFTNNHKSHMNKDFFSVTEWNSQARIDLY